MEDRITRRQFIGATVGGAAALAGVGKLRAAGAAEPDPFKPFPTKIVVRKVYLAKPVPTWPTPKLDVRAEIRKIEAWLAELGKKAPDVEFLGGELLRVSGDVPEFRAALGQPDGILIFNLTSTVGHLLGAIVDFGFPTIMFSQPYSGHDWSMVAGLQKAGKKVDVLASSDYHDILKGLAVFRTIKRLKETRILYLRNGGPSENYVKDARQKIGPEIVTIDHKRLLDAYNAVDPKEAEPDADAWIKGALKVVEPTREEIVKSSRLYLAMKNVMREEAARGIAINCLGLFYRGALPAYPCLGFSRLNSMGRAGMCEADLDSTLTHFMFLYLVGKPGFISDPVVDTATNTVIHAHCVAATKMDGPDGREDPYIIRSHLEDDKGAALQVKMRIGQVITAAKLINLDTMLVSTGKIIDTPDVDRGCRTKITTAVADAQKIMENYTGGLHRVIFYGEHVREIKRLAHFMPFNVVEEG
jgi:hypothetical protein